MPKTETIETLCKMFNQKAIELIIKNDKYDIVLQPFNNQLNNDNNQNYAILSLRMHNNSNLSHILQKITNSIYSEFHVTEYNKCIQISNYIDNITVNIVSDKLYLMEQIIL